MATELYRRMFSEHLADHDEEMIALQHKVWDPTPWVVDVFDGGSGDDRMREIAEWCEERFGPESWPIHNRPARWYRGSASINGWTFYGFDTEEAMNEFVAAWPNPKVAQNGGE